MERLLDAFGEDPRAVCRLAFGGEAGSPVVFPAFLFGALGRLSGERGGMAAAREAHAPVRLVEAESAAELLDADTPAALAEIETIYRGNGL